MTSQLNMTTLLVIYWTLPVAQHIKGQFSQSLRSVILTMSPLTSHKVSSDHVHRYVYKYIYIYIYIYIYKYIYIIGHNSGVAMFNIINRNNVM